MDLSQLVFERLSTDDELKSILVKYSGAPAIFNTEFPSDQQKGWEGGMQYPRVSYRFNMQADVQRSSSGLLRLNIYTEKNPIINERIEMLIQRRLKDVLMKPSGQAPFCVAWARTDPYLLEGMAVLCKEVTFDILEYPNQETTDPDPVMALSSYIKELFPESVVLGIDNIGDYTNSSEKPVFYCRLSDITKADGPCQHTVMWFTSNISVHLLCPDTSVRLKMIAALNQRLAVDAEVIMYDDSPMTIRGLRVNNRADYLREGQLTVTCYYGCLRDALMEPGLRKVVITDS